MKRTSILATIALAAAMAACKAKQQQQQPAPEAFPAKPPQAQVEMPAKAPPPASLSGFLMTPAKATEKAPEVFLVRFTTTKGDFTVEAHRSWAPNGADRFYNMVRAGYLDDCAFFRAVKGFMVQFGMNGKPEVNGAWSGAMFPDDPPSGQSNKRGMVTFAMAGPNTRTTQLFINFGDNTSLDGMGFTPFGTVKQGMEVVDTLYTGYGDFPSFGGRGPNPSRIATEGNGFLRSSYPQLDYIKTARLVQ